MLSNRATALSLILAHEGGKVDHPKDPGGRTNQGITQRVYDGWRTARGMHRQDVWKIGDDEVAAIYNAQYLDLIWYDKLPAGLNYAVADYAVNSGPGRAIKDLQRTLRALGKNIPADGTMGNLTIAAIREVVGLEGPDRLIQAYIDRRMAFVRSLSTWSTFGTGWTRRIVGKKDGAQPGQDNGVLDYAMAMTEGPRVVLDMPAAIGEFDDEVAAAKALPADLATMKTPEGAGTVTAGAAGILVVLNQVREELMPLVDAPYLGDSIQVIMSVLGVASAGLLLYSAVKNLQARRAG